MKSFRKIGTSVFVLAMTLIAGCGRYFAPDINLTRYATEEELVGLWRVSAETLEIAKRGGYRPEAGTAHEVVLSAGGGCVFRSLASQGQGGGYLHATGSWKLEHDTGLRGEKKRKNEVCIRIEDRGISLFLTDEDGRLLLWDFWGDPDSWEFIKYEKVR